MKSQVIAALSSKIAIGVAAATVAFGSAGAVVATQNIGSSADDHPTTTTTSTTVGTEDNVAPAGVDDESVTSDQSDDTFGAQVRELAQDPDREGGIGEEVSRLAHERNEARHDGDDDELEDDDEDEVEDHRSNRGPGSVHDDDDHGHDGDHESGDDD